MRISDWSSDVCSSDLLIARDGTVTFPSSGCSAGRCAKVSGWETDGDFWDDGEAGYQTGTGVAIGDASLSPRFIIEDYGTTSVLAATSSCIDLSKPCISGTSQHRSEEHTSEHQSLMRISYAVFGLTNKTLKPPTIPSSH